MLHRAETAYRNILRLQTAVCEYPPVHTGKIGVETFALLSDEPLRHLRSGHRRDRVYEVVADLVAVKAYRRSDRGAYILGDAPSETIF